MKVKIIHIKICLLFILCWLSWFAAAQIKDNNKKLLLGEWIWEDASMPSGERKIHFDFENSYMKFYSEIKIDGDTIFLKDNEKTQKVRLEVEKNFLGFDLPSGETFIAEWAIIGDKLYLEFSNNDIYEASKKVNVLLIYRRK